MSIRDTVTDKLRRIAVETELSTVDFEKPDTLRKILAQEPLIAFGYRLVRSGFSVQYEHFTDIKHFDEMRLKVMATKRTKKVETKEGLGQWNGLARVPFSKADKAAFEKWRGTAEVATLLDDLISEDYKVSFSYDEKHDAYMCSVSCYNPHLENFKYTMTSRAATVIDVMYLALYKHYEVAKEVWGATSEEDLMF